MQIHYADLSALFPSTKKSVLETVVAPLNAAIERFDISTSSRAAAFLAQGGHESMGFARMVENLNYSSDRLLVVFPKYFNHDLAVAYHRQPQKIASRVYANRMGNGNEASGDGWRYRGRGFFQLTGKENYEKFAVDMRLSLADAVGYLETVEGAAMSAGWFWHKRRLNELADQGRFQALTIKVNGGLHGYADRLHIYERAKHLV